MCLVPKPQYYSTMMTPSMRGKVKKIIFAGKYFIFCLFMNFKGVFLVSSMICFPIINNLIYFAVYSCMVAKVTACRLMIFRICDFHTIEDFSVPCR